MTPQQLLAQAVEDRVDIPVRCRRPIRGRRRFRLVGDVTASLDLLAREPSPDGRTQMCAVLRVAAPARNLDILRDLTLDLEPTP